MPFILTLATNFIKQAISISMSKMEGFNLLIIYSFLFYIISAARTLDTISLGQSIKDGETLVSAKESFELGFFSPGNSKSRYLGIWYKKIAEGTVTWVANRDAPLSDRSGVLRINGERNGILVLLNSTNDTVWSSNSSISAQKPVAALMESGNLVVKDGKDNNPDNILWQSFDYPCDTLLPGMKLGINLGTGLNRFLSSWKSTDDPARGDFTYGLDPRGIPQLVLRKNSIITFRAGSWNGLHWTGVPQLQLNPVYTFEYVSNEKEAFYTYNLSNSSVPSRMVINPAGTVQRYTWMERTKTWTLFSRFSGVTLDQCDSYALCGAYASCNINSNSPECECLQGFVPNSQREWDMQYKSGGCVRRTPLDCKHGDGFLEHKAVKLPDTRFSWVDKNITLWECKELCSKNCSCTAYANADVRGRGSGCLLWFHDLIDIKELPESGQDLFIRMAASELDNVERRRQSKNKKQVMIIITSISLATAVIFIGGLMYRRKKHSNQGNEKEEMELPIFDLKIIANATDNFSEKNKLGEGGFGPVYKVTLYYVISLYHFHVKRSSLL
ncbi:hypothetical protein CISIN_1g003254mg [Citrus sinensis]|uniref:Bulb-type lectin domain-containing protein n=1 Tax=Citrus sinensis TaxID=2711 RepID=A0A067G6V7_CITSI|nr:hypothetical protein CISIN_1g003254mg [Citrus sinensis]